MNSYEGNYTALYKINGFDNYRITVDGKVYDVSHGHLVRVTPTEGGRYIMYNRLGRRNLVLRRLLKLADLPYSPGMELITTYKLKTENEIKKRRDLEDKLWELKNEFEW